MKFERKIIGRGLGLGLLLLVLWVGIVSAALVDNGDGTVSDTETELMWQQAETGLMNWQSALAYCENLVLPAVGGYDDWRLPDRHELQSLVDYSRDYTCLDQTFFPWVMLSYYWTSTTYTLYPSFAWLVYFGNGIVYYNDKSISLFYARAVRSGQSGPLDPNDIDNDGDGYTENQGDCNDGDATIYPGAVEICGDGIDQDCNGSDLACFQLSSDFTVDYQAGTAPLLTQFNDSSTGAITSWFWSFGDGTSSVEQNPSHIFTEDGLYTVTLTVEGVGGTSSATDYILINDQISLMYYPHIASIVSWETEICLINADPTNNLQGVLRAYNNSGEAVSQSIPIALTPHARRQIIIGTEFTDPSEIGYLVFEGDSDNVCGYTKFFINGQYRVAVPSVFKINAGDIYVSHIVSDSTWWTGISLVNTTSSLKILNIAFDNEQNKSVTLAAKEHRAFTIAELFDDQKQPAIQSAVITNTAGVIGLELFGGGNQLSGILLKDDTASTLYYPHVASDDVWWTGIVAYNPSASLCDLTVTPFSTNGDPLASQVIPLGGHERYIGLIKNLGLPNGTAWFQVDAENEITGFELFGTNNWNQLAGYTSVGINNTEGIFPKLAEDSWTGIAFVNISEETANITLTAYNDLGAVIASKSMTVNSHGKEVDMSEDIFTQDISSATYIKYSSDQEVVGFQLNSSSDGTMLDALPGM